MATEVNVVIGASRGLGAAIAAELARRDPAVPVLATMRGGAAALPSTSSTSAASSLPPPPNLTPVPGIDIADADSACVPALRSALGDRLIRTLIISAAAMAKDEGVRAGMGGADLAAVASQFQTNALGPIRVAAALAGRIRPGGKLILVASRTGLPARIKASGTGGMVGYRASKAAALAVGLILAADLQQQGVAVASIHPGTILTDMYRSWHGLGGGNGGGGGQEAAEEAGAPAPGVPPPAAAAGVIAPRTHEPVTPEAAAVRFLDIVDSRVTLESTGKVWDEEGREMEM